MNNLRVRAGAERIKLAQSDYLTESLIPNCQLMADGQLLPVTSVSPVNQGGPPQYDVDLTMPADFILFGKQVAAKAAAKSQIDVAEADFADLLRREIDQVVDACYVAPDANLALAMAGETVTSLLDLEKSAKGRAKEPEKAKVEAGGSAWPCWKPNGNCDGPRICGHDQNSIANQNRPGVGFTGLCGQGGVLTVKAAAPSVSLNCAWAGAEQNCPDLISARRAIIAADAAALREKARAYPQVSLKAGVVYEDQVAITGFRNAWFHTLSATTTLPFTDRNQGLIMSAETTARMARANLAKFAVGSQDRN